MTHPANQSTPLASRLAAVMRRSFAPPTKLSVSEWANTHGWIARSSGASESGSYSTQRAPYMREILDVMGDELHPDIVFNKPAQVGFTEAINQFIGYVIAEDPSGLIVIQPDVEMAKAFVKERIDPMLSESPRLRGVIRSEGGRRTSDDTMQRKVFAGGFLVAIGANSPSKLRSRPTRRVIGDEVSGWAVDARSQGDPWDLAVERTGTFWNCKRLRGSTPGEEGTCPITTALADSDLRRYHVTCPACGFAEPFQWRGEDGTYRLVCDRDPANTIIPETARYLCLACGTLIPESEKPGMVQRGRWIATYPNRAVVGFDLNGLVSPWRSWAQIMTLWRDAQGTPEKLKVFVTHVLAQPWRPRSERIEVHTLTARVEPLSEAPPNVALVTGAVDVQSNRVETLTVGWAADEEAYVFDWQQHDGDPTTEEPWAAAWAALTLPLGAPLRIVAVDTGFLTSAAWLHVDHWNGRNGVRVLGVKGEDGRGRAIIRRPAAARRKGERPPWIVGVDSIKDLLALRLPKIATVGGSGTAGAIHFADTLDAVFFDQLTAEELKTVLVKGRPTRAWRPIAGRRNEALDLFVYALAGLHALGPRTLTALGALAARRAERQQTHDAPNTEPRATNDEDAITDADLLNADNRRPMRNLRQHERRPSPSGFVHRFRNGSPWKIRP